MSENLLDFGKWKRLNGEDFSLYDYIRGVLLGEEVLPDPFIAFWKLLCPEFIEYEGMVFLKEEFASDKVIEMGMKGRRPNEIEYWSNLLAVGSLIEGLPHEYFDQLIEDIAMSWRCRLLAKFPGKEFWVRILKDDDDIFLVFSQRD